MPRYSYERLSAQDNSFLLFEKPGLYMHVSSTQIFDLGPLETSEGGVDFGQIKRFIASILHRIPRYRQKLQWIPFENTPVWVDDPDFELAYHVRHAGLPRPGNELQLKKLSGRLMAQHLDRERPLWEMTVVEGLEGGRFAVITKVHHCMIDGASGVDISQILQSPSPERDIEENPPPFIPRRPPTGRELAMDSLNDRLRLPLRALRGFREFRRETENLREELSVRARAVRSTVLSQNRPASATPLNGEIGPHRAFDWCATSLEDVKALRRALDCTVNDVVLTIVTGTFREYLKQRLVDPATLDFRVQAPVSVRRDEDKGKLGNRVSAWLLRLPLEEADPLDQLAKIRQTTRELKQSQQALGVDMMMSLMEVMPSSLFSLAAQSASGSVNTIVTNVPGPQFPLYMLGAELREMYPQVPLLQNVGIGIALVSYNGRIYWGFNADPQRLPDLGSFVERVGQAFDRIAEAAQVKLSPPEAKPVRKKRKKKSAPAKTKEPEKPSEEEIPPEATA
jgi:diacylglycerol O-acyltransferase